MCSFWRRSVFHAASPYWTRESRHPVTIPIERQRKSRSYLGFDRNTYPGDAALGTLRKTFSFAGYWLNIPPGETANSWRGKREILNSQGFGFLLLFNGRLYKDLKSVVDAKKIGARDAAAAVASAKREGFTGGAIIFLDQEQGGHMLPEQRAYLHAWMDGIIADGFRAGIYCSGIPATENGQGGGSYRE